MGIARNDIGEVCSAAAFDSKIPQEREQAGRQLHCRPRRSALRWFRLTISYEGIRFPETTPHISTSVQERGIDGLARTNLRFS
jgi:hypothetical protein